MQDRYVFTDSATATLSYAGTGTVTDDASLDDVDTVTRDGPWTDFFGTDQFVQFEATVAQPIVQPYVHDGELKRFRKDESELKRAQAQIDNLPWTLGHPDPHDRVTHADQIRGVWEDPHWDDGQQATLNVPANDEEALQYAFDHEDVSPGFSGTLDWTDADDEEYDATQRNLAYDHIASVDNGRCPPERGCGLHTDGIDEETHGHVQTFADALQSVRTEEGGGTSEWRPGEWVAFEADGERHHGKIEYVDEERALVVEYDTAGDQLADEATTVATSNLRAWVGPHADDCGGTCHCGLHTHSATDDAPDGLYVADGSWYGIAPSETADDEPKYRLDDCNDVKDAYNLRNNGDYTVDTDTLVARIQRASEAHDCPPDQRPWADAAERLAHFIATQ